MGARNAGFQYMLWGSPMKKAFVLILAALTLTACGSSRRDYNNYPDDPGYGQYRHRDRGDSNDYRAGFEAGRDDGAAYVCSSVRRTNRDAYEDLRDQNVCR